MKFSGHNVLITGGSRGIGRATAHAFAAEGARVAINYVSNDKAAQQCIDSLPGDGHISIRKDVGNANEVKQLVDEALQAFGHLDVLVINAAIHEHHPVDNVTYEHWQDEWRKTINTNLIGAANLTWCASQHMIARKSGRIIYISSRGAFRGEPDQPAYGASKGGMNSLGQSMAQALGKYNIGVGLVAPGFVETEMVGDILKGERGDAIRAQSPFGRVAKPEEVANAVLYLADPKSIWSSGAIIDVNGASYLR